MPVKKYSWLLLLFCLTLPVLLPGCFGKSSVNGANSSSPPSTAIATYYTPSPEDIKAGNKTVTDMASAIESKDTKAVSTLFTVQALSGVKGDPDLTSPQAASLIQGFRNAKIVKSEKDAFTYQMTVNGVAITFLVIKEDGKWKIAE